MNKQNEVLVNEDWNKILISNYQNEFLRFYPNKTYTEFCEYVVDMIYYHGLTFEKRLDEAKQQSMQGKIQKVKSVE